MTVAALQFHNVLSGVARICCEGAQTKLRKNNLKVTSLIVEYSNCGADAPSPIPVFT